MVRLPLAIVYYRFAARSVTPRKRGEQELRPVSLSNTNLSLSRCHHFITSPKKKKRQKGLPLSEGYGMIAENNSGLSRRDLRIAF